uniref:Uncharacterized protein n=1 Tax=Neospora caninum (strain Liverpool) TaxID=572307 RepID=A0A0F7UDJ7_NEOCL|nr:TPA: hypothetical protein BN1204_037085 [Neospora caninum Liverpool]
MDKSVARNSSSLQTGETIQLSGAEQRFLTVWRRHAGVSREPEAHWQPVTQNSYGGAGVSMVMNGSRCSWQCPLTCAIKYLPGCTNDCLESRRWCLKYANVREPSTNTNAADVDDCTERFPQCMGQGMDETAEPFQHVDDLGSPSKRFLAGKHAGAPPSSAGAFFFRRGLESVSRSDPSSAEGFGDSENYEDTERVDSDQYVIVGDPNMEPAAASLAIPSNLDEGGRFRGASRQRHRACRSASTASTDCDDNYEYDVAHVAAKAVDDKMKEDNTMLQKRSRALRQ